MEHYIGHSTSLLTVLAYLFIERHWTASAGVYCALYWNGCRVFTAQLLGEQTPYFDVFVPQI